MGSTNHRVSSLFIVFSTPPPHPPTPTRRPVNLTYHSYQKHRLHHIVTKCLICISVSRLVSFTKRKKLTFFVIVVICIQQSGDHPPRNVLHFLILPQTPAWSHRCCPNAIHSDLIGIHSEVCSVRRKLCSLSMKLFDFSKSMSD